MAVVEVGTERVPVWAMRYLTEGDRTGMTDEERLIISEFLDRFKDLGCVTFTCEDRRPFMCGMPAFGMPCECVEVNVHGRT